MSCSWALTPDTHTKLTAARNTICLIVHLKRNFLTGLTYASQRKMSVHLGTRFRNVHFCTDILLSPLRLCRGGLVWPHICQKHTRIGWVAKSFFKSKLENRWFPSVDGSSTNRIMRSVFASTEAG